MIDVGGNVIEMGAQWVHGEGNNVVFPLADAAQEIQSDIFSVESTGLADNVVAAYPDGRKIEPEKLREFSQIIADIRNISQKELVDWNTSLGDYFVHK